MSTTMDAVAGAAVTLARAAAEDDAGAGRVGEHLGGQPEGERLVTHRFAALDPAYRGWEWAVTVARASRARQPTVSEVVLLPGPDALVAPPWVPWEARVRPGDLGPGDLLPAPPGDPRLVPVAFDTTDPTVLDLGWELGLGRARVLSADGRDAAAERWQAGEAGPAAAIARSAPGRCASCGFLVPLAGALRPAFGVCANAYAVDDGRVVAVDHGCGAHSEAALPAVGPAEIGASAEDLADYQVIAPEGAQTGSVSEADAAEPLGHS